MSVESSNLLWEMLQDKEYRESFVQAQLVHGIPFQIRGLMDAQDLTQNEVAERGRTSQGTVSRAMNPNYGGLTVHSIVRIAAGLDVAFIGQFVSFGDLVRWFDALPEWDRKAILKFADEDARRKRVRRDAVVVEFTPRRPPQPAESTEDKTLLQGDSTPKELYILEGVG